jgi:sulfur carrier protein
MRITVNGESREIPEGGTLLDLLERSGVNRGRVACEVNGELVRRADHASAVLREGDAVEIVQMIGGG